MPLESPSSRIRLAHRLALYTLSSLSPRLPADNTQVAAPCLWRVVLIPLADGNKRTRKRRRKRRGLVGFLLGMEGGLKGEGMPQDVFWVVMDLVMPSWDHRPHPLTSRH